MKVTHRQLTVVGASLLATAILSTAALTSSLGGFSAVVANQDGQAGSGTLLLTEGVGSTTCISTGTGTSNSSSVSTNANLTCPAEIFGTNGTNLEPGGTATSATLTLSNPGTIAGSTLTLTPGTCSVTDNTDPGGIANTYFGTAGSAFCNELDITIESGSGSTASCIFPEASSTPCGPPSAAGTLGDLATTTLPGIAAGGSATYTLSLALDSSATNSDQGLEATLPVTFTLNQ